MPSSDFNQEDKEWITKNTPEGKEPLPWENDLPEAPASATCKVESPNGFQYLFTLRSLSGKDLLTKLTSFELNVLGQNWKPLDQWVKRENGNGKEVIKPKTNLPLCPIHNKLMKERTGQDGSKFYSHAMETEDGEWIYCSGKGYGKK